MRAVGSAGQSLRSLGVCLACPVLLPTGSLGAAEADTPVDETRERAPDLVKERVHERPGRLPALALDGTGYDRRRLVH